MRDASSSQAAFDILATFLPLDTADEDVGEYFAEALLTAAADTNEANEAGEFPFFDKSERARSDRR